MGWAPRYFGKEPRLRVVVMRFAETQGLSTISREDVSKVFKELVASWLRDTVLVSSVEDMVLHAAYQQIIGMGEKAIPWLLEELRSHPNHWFWALKSITRTDPVEECDRGNFDRMVEAWLSWGKQHGYLR
jgi:hypothetical protein